MYAVPGDWTVDKLDWHQLGCMIAHCIEGFDDYHNMTVPEYLKKDCFISKLIDQGIIIAMVIIIAVFITVCSSLPQVSIAEVICKTVLYTIMAN